MEGCTHYLAIVLVQLVYGGSNVLIKHSLQKGLHPIVSMVYRHVLPMVFVGPFAYVLERKQRPSLSFSIAAKIFVLASIGTTIHLNVYYAGLAYTSPTVGCASTNVIPALTFLMAVLLGMEKLKIRSARGQVKVTGTLFCIGGSLVFTFWEGYLFKGFIERPLINVLNTEGTASELRHVKQNWIKGSALVLTSHIAWSAWLIIQAAVSKVYRAPLLLSTMICFFPWLQSSFLAMFFVRDPNSWETGVEPAAFNNHLLSMFSTLQVITVGMFSAIVFAERLHLGNLIGALLIIVGLYCVLWGKRKDVLVAEHAEIDKVTLDDDKVVEIYMNDISVVNPVTREKT